MASLGFAKQLVDVNPASRVIQGALTGIGFIGAGVIAHDKDTGDVSGLTTAASVWITAALGVVCGLGAWRIVLVASALTLALLIVGGRIEDAIRKRVRRVGIVGRELEPAVGRRARGDRRVCVARWDHAFSRLAAV